MVKVFKCHNFKSQSIIPTNGEPIEICSYADLALAATHNCTVEVYRVERKHTNSKISSFHTEAPVQQILYNKIGNYISTVECKKARRQEFYSVKVYLNWESSTEGDRQRARIRLAGKNRNLKPEELSSSSFQIIGLPFQHKVSSIATCQQTGNLVIAQRDTTLLYHLVEKCIANSDRRYIDVESFLELHWSFDITKISLCENYISVLSKEEVQVAKVLFFDKSKHTSDPDVKHVFDAEASRHRLFKRKLSSVVSNQSGTSATKHDQSRSSSRGQSRVSQLGSSRNSSNPSPAHSSSSLSRLGYGSYSVIKDDEHFVQWNFDDEDLKSDLDMSGTGSLVKQSKKSQKTILLRGLQELSNRDLLLAANPTVKDLRGGGHQTMGEVQVVTVLYKRQNNSNEDWAFLQLIPTYYSCITPLMMPEMSRIAPMQSANYGAIVGMSCLLSSPTTGYNYDVWMQTSLLSHYKYTLDAIQIETDGNLLYVLNGKGLEIFTCRSHSAVIPKIEDINNVTKAFPAVTMETCLSGVHPFIGGQQVVLADKFVTLLTKIDGTHKQDSIWNLYALEKCSEEELIRDMIGFGCRHQKSSSSTYLHMLEESHMTLKSVLLGDEGSQSELTELYRESCALLGEYYSLPGCTDWSLCLPYYLMSELSVTDIVKRAVQYKQQSKQSAPYCYGKGFLHYLNYILFQDEESIHLAKEEGDQILQVYSEACPDKLSQVMLFSRVKAFTSEKAVKLLQDFMLHCTDVDDKQRAVDMLALSCLHLELCDPESAQVALGAIPPDLLTQICVGHHYLLHDNFTQLTPLSQLMRCHCSVVLILSLVGLHDTGMIPLDLAIKLLQGSHESEKLSKNTHIKDYLEVLLEDVKRKYIFDEAMTLLTSIYMERLLEWKPPVVRQRHTSVPHLFQSRSYGHFGQRYCWLNSLPPFRGVASIKQPCSYIQAGSPSVSKRVSRTKESDSGIKDSNSMGSKDGSVGLKEQKQCTCYQCNEDLIKLQSILCSSLCTTRLSDVILTKIEQNPSIRGHNSLWILCKLRCRESPHSVVVEKYPSVLLEYGKSVCATEVSQWKSLLTALLEFVREEANAKSGNDSHTDVLKDILSHLSESISTADFLNLLPSEGNFSFFLPYIYACQEKESLNNILNTIIKSGEKLRVQ